MSSQPLANTPKPPALLARLIRAPLALALKSKLRVGLLVGLLAAVIGLGLAGGLAFRSGKSEPTGHSLAPALEKLESGDYAAARTLAAALRSDESQGYEHQGGTLYVLGAVAAHEAEQHLNPHQQELLYLVAARYLEESRSRGFPKGKEAEGSHLLGKALHHSGRFAQSLPYLHEALLHPERRAAELHRLLADSYLQLSPPKFDQALEQVRLYLAVPNLTPGEIDAGHLLEGRILLAMEDFPLAAEAADKVAAASPHQSEAVLLRAEIAVRSPAGEKNDLAATIKTLRQLQTQTEASAQAQFLIGRCYQLAGDNPAAIAQFDRVRRTWFGSQESFAAAIHQAELVRATGQPAEAVALYQRALAQAGPRDGYRNRWLPLEDLEKRMQAATDELIAGQHFAEAIDLAPALPPLLPQVLSLQQQVAAHEAWGLQLLKSAEPLAPALSEVTRAEARQHFREAGVLSEKLAAARIATRHYLGDLARAAGNLLRGQNYREAARLYRHYLRQDPSTGQPEAEVGLGEALVALGRLDEARQTLGHCRETWPAHPATYRARLLESYALQEQGKLREARSLLEDNLYRFALAPQSADWRDSLFGLGNLLYHEALVLETKSRQAGVDRAELAARQEGLKLLEESHANFQEAIGTLTQAVERYPQAHQAAQARYRIAEAYRHSAKWPRKKLGVVTIETNRVALHRQIQQELHLALEQYNLLLASLADQPAALKHEPVAAALLRNCYFGRADALYDLGCYEEAIKAYSDATNRYQHEPESLPAYMQIASCYRALKRPGEARGTMEQARVVLERIRPDADFARTTPLDRQAWSDLLAWLRTL